MRYKCKFCGYRFKDKDERICPECFTAREDDISCGQYSDDLHSHEIFGDRYRRNDYVSPGNDTFKEEAVSFAEEERREEQHSKFSKIEQIHKAEPTQTEFIPKSGDSVYNNANGQSFGSSNAPNGNFIPSGNSQRIPNLSNENFPFPRQTVNQFQRLPNGFTIPSYNQKNRKKNSGCGVVVFFIVIIAIIIIAAVFSSVEGYVSEHEDYDHDYYEENVDYDDDGFSNYTSDVQVSSYGNFTIDQDYYSAYYYDSTFIDEEKFSHLTLGDDSFNDSESGHGSYLVDEPIYEIYTSYSLNLTENRDVNITSIVCKGSTYSGEILSTYDVLQSELESDTDEGNVTPILLCSGNADNIEVTVTVNCDGSEETFTFNLDTDADE